MPSPEIIDPGEMRHQLTWQTYSKVPNPARANQPSRTPIVKAQGIWGKIEPLVGMELYNARQLKSETSIKVTTWDFGSISAGDSLVDESGNVMNVSNVFRYMGINAFLIIHCWQENGNG